MKKISAAIAALMVAGSLAACGSSNPASSASPSVSATSTPASAPSVKPEKMPDEKAYVEGLTALVEAQSKKKIADLTAQERDAFDKLAACTYKAMADKQDGALANVIAKKDAKAALTADFNKKFQAYGKPCVEQVAKTLATPSAPATPEASPSQGN
ncbi:putative ATPase with chaperone activity [Arcanobacterium wilhelmae]|uniref:ATPase with chaperone activity n=1 Tax=Arcanobacterium wilhelmae TaxID=1803177 RepID=A0ABT9NBA0_9ACTO|nr:hypothetical protein [Arcanobacterium wilhelmae]MDP9800965.1 putative ATPase with chaperone activity [Arcanobacterium wilhelmae]WFN90325.1 hypothetical protein P8A24_00245 [Arcanobacterium wilhelmae]